jgi:hypothetical protein
MIRSCICSNSAALVTEIPGSVLRRILHWNGSHDAYSVRSEFVSYTTNRRRMAPTAVGILEAWRQFWDSPEPGCVQGAVKFQGGDVLSRAVTAPEKLTPADFRLRPDSVGYRAGTNGKDLGADIDLVGPGAGYERWKKTPEYQHWLRDTKQSPSSAN